MNTRAKEELVEKMSRFPGENCASFITSGNGATKPTLQNSAPRSAVLGENLEDLLHERAFNDLLRQTLQNSVQGEDLKDLHSDANRRRRLPSPPFKNQPLGERAETPKPSNPSLPCTLVTLTLQCLLYKLE